MKNIEQTTSLLLHVRHNTRKAITFLQAMSCNVQKRISLFEIKEHVFFWIADLRLGEYEERKAKIPHLEVHAVCLVEVVQCCYRSISPADPFEYSSGYLFAVYLTQHKNNLGTITIPCVLCRLSSEEQKSQYVQKILIPVIESLLIFKSFEISSNSCCACQYTRCCLCHRM